MRRRDSEELLDPKSVKAITPPIRVEILAECSLAPITVSEFRTRRKPGLRRQAIEYHFGILVECGAIEVVETRQERGGRAKFYSAVVRALFSAEDFNRMPPALRGSVSASYLSTLTERIQESLLAGTLDAHTERHLSWMPLELDWAGFLEAVGEMNDLLPRLKIIAAEAKARMSVGKSTPMDVTVAMMGFESPQPIRAHRVEH